MTSGSADQLELLLRITGLVNDRSSVGEILDAVGPFLGELIPHDRLEYAVVEDDQRTMRTEWVASGYESVACPVGFRYTRSTRLSDVPGYLEPFLDNDLPAYAAKRDEDHPVSRLVAENVISSLSCPLVVGGEVVGFLFFGSRTPDVYGPGHLGLIRQISGQLAFALEQTRLNQHLKTMNAALVRERAARERVVAGVAHELRTPLTVALGLAAELRDGLDSFEQGDVRTLAALIAGQANEMAAVLDDLIAVVRHDVGDLAIESSAFEIDEEIERTLREIDLWNRVVAKLDGGRAYGDPRRIRQVVRNLAQNAVRYGGPSVRVESGRDSHTVYLAVSDDGPGVPMEDRDQIFEAYGRSGPARNPESLGLGLFVARTLVTAMGGEISYSHEAGWSRFEVRLPAVAPETVR